MLPSCENNLRFFKVFFDSLQGRAAIFFDTRPLSFFRFFQADFIAAMHFCLSLNPGVSHIKWILRMGRQGIVHLLSPPHFSRSRRRSRSLCCVHLLQMALTIIISRFYLLDLEFAGPADCASRLAWGLSSKNLLFCCQCVPLLPPDVLHFSSSATGFLCCCRRLLGALALPSSNRSIGHLICCTFWSFFDSLQGRAAFLLDSRPLSYWIGFLKVRLEYNPDFLVDSDKSMSHFA